MSISLFYKFGVYRIILARQLHDTFYSVLSRYSCGLWFERVFIKKLHKSINKACVFIGWFICLSYTILYLLRLIVF